MTWLRANAPIVLVGLCVLLRMAMAIGAETYPDEAYYWTWAQHPQLAYFDHPAMIAWSIGLLGIRFGAFFWGVAALAGVHHLTLGLGGSRDSAWWATALFASTPAASLLATFSTPDAPLLAFWVWTLIALVRKQPVLTGVLWGLAMLSKYNGILLGLPVLLVFFRRPAHLLGATLIALAVTSPTIIWNAMNDWEGFRFQLAHGLGGGGGSTTFLEFVAGQFLMGGPVLVVLVAWWLVRERAAPLLKFATVLPLLFFGYASWKARGEANWAAASWMSASVGLALTPLAKWKRAAAGLNLAVLAIGTGVLLFPPKELWAWPPVQKLHGWKWLERVADQKVPVITRRYQLSALASMYGHVPATTLEGRRSQYDLWPQPEIPVGSDAVWIGEWEGPPGELVERFETSTQLDWPLDDRQMKLHPFLAFRMGKAKAASQESGGRPRTILEAIGSTSHNNPELASLFEADQSDRKDPVRIDWIVVKARDEQRLVRVVEMLREGLATTSADYYRAAMVFQHGDGLEQFQRAHELAIKAVELNASNGEARWLAAAAKDRWLMAQGKPQLYGTQIVVKDGRRVLYDVDPSITDEERARWNVPSLDEARKALSPPP